MQEKNKYKFLATVICLFLLPFIIVSRHFAIGSRSLQKNETLRHSEMRTVAGAGIAANEINTSYNLSRLTGDKKFLAAGTGGRKAEMALKVKETPLIYSELALLTASGREVCRVAAGKDGKPLIDYAKSGVFAEAKKTAAAAGAVEYGEYTPPALVLAGPVGAPGGKPEYFLAARLSLAYLGELVRLMGKNSPGNFGLLDGGGQIIADSMNMSTVKPGIQAPPEVLKLIAAAQERSLRNFAREISFKGSSSLVSVSNVAGTRWWIYEITDSADIPSYVGSSRVGKVVFTGILMIILFALITHRLAMVWLVRGNEAAGAKQGQYRG